jgi:hypothetical protein
MFKNTPKAILFVFILSMSLRLVLAFLNRDANDNHMEVINWIVDKHDLPEKNDCGQCYHLKLFYVLSAGIIKSFHLTSENSRIVSIQLFNVLLGFLTLLFFWKFIKKYPANKNIKIITFAFFAFNPCLVGINVQVTNDTLVILSGVLTVYFTDMLLNDLRVKYALGLVIFLIIAAMTKATGLVLFAIVSIVFILKILSKSSKKKRKVLLKYFLTIFVVFMFVVPFAGGYYTYYKKYKSLPTSMWAYDAPPKFFESTSVNRPGVRNMAEGFFTFQYLDMIRQPYINNESDNFPLHRTSLWSQLYGRTVFMHFDQWPGSWQTTSPLIVNVGRVLIIIGIIPLLLFLLGLFKGLSQALKRFFKKGISSLSKSNNYIHLIVTVVFLLCSIKYSYSIRDFSSMKSIYIFPGFISYIKLFLDKFSSIQSQKTIKIISIILITMVLLSIYDIGYLTYQLGK